MTGCRSELRVSKPAVTRMQGAALVATFVCLLLAGVRPACAQAPTSDAAPPYTVAGSVVNGLTGAPIARALVRVNARAAMTDALGHFSFPDFTATTGSVQVLKPGYAFSPDDPGASFNLQPQDLTARLDYKLYPNAILTGVVLGSDRLPIEHAQVILLRESWDENGVHSIPVGFSQTDSHGEYRFSESPGRYRITVPFSARANPDGSVLLPAAWPGGGSPEAPASFFAASGQERRIDLHPRTATAWPVRFRIDGAENHQNPRITVHGASGDSFSVFSRSTGEDGVLELQLPSGSYDLQAMTQNRDGLQQAEAHITVAGHALDGLILHFGPVTSLPVEMVVEAGPNTPSGTAAQPPRLNNLGLDLQNITRQAPGTSDQVNLSSVGNDQFVFQAGPGIYRLHAQYLSAWHIRSATCAGVNLLMQPLTIASGAAGQPIRLVVSHDLGQLSGRVTGAAARSVSFVYLLAHQPTLFPVLLVQTDQEGAFDRAVPPGSYTAYAFPRRSTADLRNQEIVSHLVAGKEIDMPAAGKVSVELAVQPAELAR